MACFLNACLVILFFISPVAFADTEYWTEFERIKGGKQYPNNVPKGVSFREHQPGDEKVTYYYAIHVPENYSADRKWPVHFFLHGGVGRSSKKVDQDKIRKFDGFKVPDSISVYPRSWGARTWWERGQEANINDILKTLKEEYNVDEDRVFIQGVSDGGTGAYYVASHYPTAFAGFVSLIGSIRVLNPGNDTYGMTFHGNFTSKPIYAINTTRDPLYPAREQKKIIETINNFGGNVKWVIKKGKHNLDWFNEVRGDIRLFVKDTVRNPYPDYLQWQIDEGTEFKRIHWLIAGDLIDEQKEGVVNVQKRDNDIFLSSINMRDATLLLSTEHFDFNQNIRIWINKNLVFNQKVSPSTKMLKKWFDIDNDRSMLFAGEIRVLLFEETQ